MTDHLTLLRQLDPSPAATPELSGRARADLERILATERRPARPPVRPRTRGRLAVGLVAAAALAVAGVLAPAALHGGDTAFASWTPTGRGLSPEDRADAGASCRDALAEGDMDDPALQDSAVAVAERRGVWTTVVLAGEGGFSGLCITDGSAGWFRGDMIGSVGVAAGTATVGDRALVAIGLGSGTMSAGDLSLAVGVAGSQVRAVRLRTETHGVVEATVADGRFALWFPGDELEGRGVVPVEVEYADGSSARVRLAL